MTDATGAKNASAAPEKPSVSPEKMTSKKRANGEENEEKEEERPILEIREQASEIKKSVLAFCMDPNKKVNKEPTTQS